MTSGEWKLAKNNTEMEKMEAKIGSNKKLNDCLIELNKNLNSMLKHRPKVKLSLSCTAK